MELLRNAAVRADRAVIVVTHDNRVFQFGERIAHMDDGRIVRIEDRAVASCLAGPFDPIPRPGVSVPEVFPVMFTKYLLPVLAVAGVVFSVYTVIQAQQVPPPGRPIIEPPTRPDRVMMIAGSGLVEARRENIPIGVNVPGVVTEVFIKKGEKVKAGVPLFRTDDRDYKAQLDVRLAELVSAKAQLHKLESAPRPEDIPPARAAAEEAEARMNDAEAAMARTERLFRRNAIPASDYDKDRYAFLAAKATFAKAKAELERILAGTWKEDTRRRPRRGPARPEPGGVHQDQPGAADRPRPDGWRDPPAQYPAGAVCRLRLEGADDRAGRHSPPARPGQHR